MRIASEPAPAPADALAIAVRAAIHRIPVPTPFRVGRVNCYLVEDQPLTLIDTGPNSGTSLDELERTLGRLGHAIEDLELIVLTHQHMDHVGLLEVLVRRSGAEVAAFQALKPYLADFTASAAADDEFARRVMRRNGVPDELATVLGSVGAAFRAFGSSGPVTHELRDGDLLRFRNRTLQVFHRPGHSPSDVVFWDPERRIVICGDHLLPHISSSPIVSRPLERSHPEGGRQSALINHLESMRATRELAAGLVLPGHGDPIADHVELIDERVRLHLRRARKIHRMLTKGPMSAYETALRMWGSVAVTQAYLTLSEVLGHLDLLVRDGHARAHDDGEMVSFEALHPGP